MAHTFKDLQRLTNILPASNRERRLGLFILCALGISGLNFLLLLTIKADLGSLSNRQLPVLVQMSNGKTAEVKLLEYKERPPQLIKDFTRTALADLFSWGIYLPLTANDDPRQPKLDPGAIVEIKSAKIAIPSTVYAGSLKLEETFGKKFTSDTLAPLISQLGIMQGKSQMAISIREIQDPIPVKTSTNEKLWKVNVIATLIVKASTDLPDKLISFNKTIYLRAIEPSIPPPAGTKNYELAQLLAMAQASGVQIYGIESYQSADTKPVESANMPSSTQSAITPTPAPTTASTTAK